MEMLRNWNRMHGHKQTAWRDCNESGRAKAAQEKNAAVKPKNRPSLMKEHRCRVHTEIHELKRQQVCFEQQVKLSTACSSKPR